MTKPALIIPHGIINSICQNKSYYILILRHVRAPFYKKIL